MKTTLSTILEITPNLTANIIENCNFNNLQRINNSLTINELKNAVKMMEEANKTLRIMNNNKDTAYLEHLDNPADYRVSQQASTIHTTYNESYGLVHSSTTNLINEMSRARGTYPNNIGEINELGKRFTKLLTQNVSNYSHSIDNIIQHNIGNPLNASKALQSFIYLTTEERLAQSLVTFFKLDKNILTPLKETRRASKNRMINTFSDIKNCNENLSEAGKSIVDACDAELENKKDLAERKKNDAYKKLSSVQIGALTPIEKNYFQQLQSALQNIPNYSYAILNNQSLSNPSSSSRRNTNNPNGYVARNNQQSNNHNYLKRTLKNQGVHISKKLTPEQKNQIFNQMLNSAFPRAQGFVVNPTPVQAQGFVVNPTPVQAQGNASTVSPEGVLTNQSQGFVVTPAPVQPSYAGPVNNTPINTTPTTNNSHNYQQRI